MKKKLLSFALSVCMLLGMSACLPENVFTDSTSINADAFNVLCEAFGHDWEYDSSKAKEPSCFEDGYSYKYCKRCGEVEKPVRPAYGDHSWGYWETVLEPTCKSEGLSAHVCWECGAKESKPIAKAEHTRIDGPPKKTVYPTCTARGYRVYKCKWCSEEITEYFGEPAGHKWSDWKVANPATCTSDGVETQTCSECKAVERRTVKATGHSLTEWKTTKGASCKEDGERERHCQNANCNYRETETITKAKHNWSKWRTIKETSCKEMGKQERTCAGCGEKETQNIAIIAHNYTWKTTKAATCCAEGERVGTCSMCGNKVTEKTAKAGHSWKDPEWTWSADNKTATAKFVCKLDKSHTQTLTANSVFDSEPATCTAKGEAGYVAQVTIDGKKYSTFKVTQTTEKLSHNFSDWKITGFDTKKGTSILSRYCSKCGGEEEKTGSTAVYRLAGKGRYETAAAISKQGFEKADTVVLAYSMNYADALAGVPLAANLKAPILLTDKGKLDAATAAEITRLGAKKAVILGGEGAISKPVEKQVQSMGLSTERLAGSSRFGTATKIARKLNEKPTAVFFVYGLNYADALSVSTVAAVMNAPVIYLKTNGAIDEDTKAYLEDIKGSVKNAYVIGGKGVISDDMKEQAEKLLGITAKRVSGANRYETCVEVNTEFKNVLYGKSVCLATGLDFPDALAGGVFAAQKKSPLLLVNGKSAAALNDSQKVFLKAQSPYVLYIFGGTGAVCDRKLKW